MPASKEQMQKIAQYQRENNEQILLKPRKSDRISERIELAIQHGKAKSRQDYILRAVKEALERDGFPLDFDNLN